MDAVQESTDLAWRARLSNLREVGGPGFQDGRPRTVYRSDTQVVDPSVYPQTLTATLDLRRDDEIDRVRHPLTDLPGYRRVPLFDPSSDIEAAPDAIRLDEQYIDWLHRHRAAIAVVFDALAEVDGDALVCCSAGKDRTGVVSALLARLWGADLEQIGSDYAITKERLAERFAYELSISDDRERSLIQQACDPEVMITVIEHVEQQYGGVVDYLLSIGVPQEKIDKL